MQSSKKVTNGWAMYDWANSAYNLVITTTIFPVYYDAITTVKDSNNKIIFDDVTFLGTHFKSGALYEYAISFAYLVIALLSPMLSSIADGRGSKKRFMQFFCFLGAIACCAMFFFTKERLNLGIICCILAAIGYCGSLVFYNSYLPEIAPVEEQDRVSAKGFAYGYIGSVLLQIICFVFVLAKPFGMDAAFASRLSFLLVGLWWIGFAQITFSVLPKVSLNKNNKVTLFNKGFVELKKVWLQVKTLPVLKKYLFAFFFYSMGVQTVMIAATLFGSQELGLGETQLISCILIIQLVAIGGSYLMAKLSEKYGNINVLAFVVVLWVGICAMAYFIQSAMGFYIVAVLVGIVMGGIQSLSRSTYSKLMPETKDTASFFSFYDVTEKLAIVIGTFSFGLIHQVTGSMRNSILALIVFFAIGLIGLVITRRKQKIVGEIQ